MNNMEEILWNFIDGNCTAEEQKTITGLIAGDESYRLKYQELMQLNNEFSAMELDEPSMAFTYNVMEVIRTEHAHVPLKATINKRIILGITIFFVLTLMTLLVVVFANFNWAGQKSPVNLSLGFTMPDINFSKARPLLEGFLFFDVVLGLYLFDTWLRRRNLAKQV